MRGAQLLAVLSARCVDAARFPGIATALGKDRAAHNRLHIARERDYPRLATRHLAVSPSLAGSEDRGPVVVHRHRHICIEARKNKNYPPYCLADGASGIFIYCERGRDAQPDALANSIGN